MNIDPALVKLLTGDSLQAHRNMDDKWGAFKPIIDAQRQTRGVAPGQPGILAPQETPNTPVIDANELMLDQAYKQNMIPPDYLPPIPENVYDPNKERMSNMLKLLENYYKWKKGESP